VNTRLCLIGVDHHTAPLAAREKFAGLAERWREIGAAPGVLGVVILSTCNRVEIYLSLAKGDAADPLAILALALGVKPEEIPQPCQVYWDEGVVEHLFRVASGLVSQVPGDSQILTQVREAAEASRLANCTDPLLEALFRFAVTTGKRVRTEVSLFPASSLATLAVSRMGEILGSLKARPVLVIGAGEMARLTAEGLLAGGAAVTLAVRGGNRPRPGLPSCPQIPFENRYAALATVEAVVSATRSSDFTLAAAPFAEAERHPALLVDLAFPPDIDPEIASVPGVTFLNLDHLEGGAFFPAALAQAETIIVEEATRFEGWRRNRSCWRGGQERPPFFPIFIDLLGAQVLVVGGGRVAGRRLTALLSFGAKVRLVAPEVGPEVRGLLGEAGLTWIKRAYQPSDLEGVGLAIAATDSRQVNQQVGREAAGAGILVSVADRHDECGFFFPALVQGDSLTAGLISNRGDHALVGRAAVRLRKEIAAIEATGGEPGEPAGDTPG
jgi:glutamyl-tRNA reductase